MTSTCGWRPSSASRASLLPATRWSSSTPSRRPGPGRTSRTTSSRWSAPSSRSTTTPSMRRSSPHTFSTSSASCTPSTRMRLPARDACLRARRRRDCPTRCARPSATRGPSGSATVARPGTRCVGVPSTANVPGQVAVAPLEPGVAAQHDVVAVERDQRAGEPGRAVQHPQPGRRLAVRVLRGGARRAVDRPREDPARCGLKASARTREPGVHFTGMCLMPPMKFDSSRSGSPASCMSGRRVTSSVRISLSSMRGQVGAEAEVRAAAAERDVRVRVAGDVEHERVVPHLLVAVGRDVPDDDPVARLDLPAADLGVDGRGAAEVQHRRRPAQDLLDRVVDAGRRGRSCRSSNCSGLREERVHAVRGRVAGGLVARDREQQHEHVELELAELLALDLGVEELGDDVVARVAARARPASSLT